MDNNFTNRNNSCENEDDLFDSIRNLLTNSKIKEMGYDYQEANNEKLEDNMNVFKMVSDHYYYENFHSDILRFFLCPDEKHKEGTVFLFAFIDYLNTSFKDKIFIPKHNYESAIVEREQREQREQGRIDILIKSDATKHCVIIENKMNNASDTERQLPKYYDAMVGNGYTVDAIVYLPLDVNKRPDQLSWNETDKQHVLPLLCVLPAYQKTGISLVDGWILPCIQKTRNIDCISVLRQYAELIKQLNKDIMNDIILGKFYQFLKDEKENIDINTVQSVQNFTNDLSTYMAKRLLDHYRQGDESKRDYEAWNWHQKPQHFGIIFHSENVWYKVDVWSSISGYSIFVFGQEKITNNRLIDWAEGMKSLDGFNVNEKGEYQKIDFSFYDEEKVIKCVDALIIGMRERLKQLKLID